MEIERFDPKEMLLFLLGDNPSARRKKQVAEMLARLIKRQTPFSISYIENIYSGRWELSEGDLLRALYATWRTLREDHPTLGAFEPIEVLAIPGTVIAGSMVLGATRYCPICGMGFIPTAHNQVYCCREHKREAKRERRRRRGR